MAVRMARNQRPSECVGLRIRPTAAAAPRSLNIRRSYDSDRIDSHCAAIYVHNTICEVIPSRQRTCPDRRACYQSA